MIQGDEFLRNSAIVFYFFECHIYSLLNLRMSFLKFSGHFSGSQLSDEFIDLDVANQSSYEEENYAEIFSLLEKIPVRMETVEIIYLN